MSDGTSYIQALKVRHGGFESSASFATATTTDLRLPQHSPELILNDAELARFRGFQFAAKQNAFLLGRLAAKRAIGQLLGEPELRHIEIVSGVYGQPLMRHPRSGDIDVTLSHSQQLAVALAFPHEYPMGIDLESVAENSAAMLIEEMAASDQEKAWITASPLNIADSCGLLWTAREALGKLLKTGLRSPMNLFSLGEIQPLDATAWAGNYRYFLQCRSVSRVDAGRVLSIALPVGVELHPWPGLV
ncbi:MAG: 4'-phosphopantetheinyl transferase family protein [Burkholderiales bacterium]